MQNQHKLRKRHFIGAFLFIVAVLFAVRTINPGITNSTDITTEADITEHQNGMLEEKAGDLLATNLEEPDMATLEPAMPIEDEASEAVDTESFEANRDTTTISISPIVAPIPKTRIERQSRLVDSIYFAKRNELILVNSQGKRIRNKIKSVKNYRQCFNDLNDVQLATAQALGIEKIEDRTAAAKNLDGLVYVGDNAFYGIKPLTHSIAYLVPRAAICLEEIARAFIDSCATKGVPIHKIMLTSVLRTEKDVKRLRRVNLNASENSCHQYGTTFDISYNHFIPIEKKNGPPTSSTKLKQILAEVLEDQHEMGTCYIKYEHLRSACFHITAR